MPPTKPKVTREDLAYLGQPLVRSQSTPQAEEDTGCKEPSELEVDQFDSERERKRRIVKAYEIIKLALNSPFVPILEKAKLAMGFISQQEGTKRVIEWDTRIKDEKQVLKNLDKTIKQLQVLSKDMSPEKVAEVQLGAAAKILQDFDKSGSDVN